jgi:hypothetical protein
MYVLGISILAFVKEGILNAGSHLGLFTSATALHLSASACDQNVAAMSWLANSGITIVGVTFVGITVVGFTVVGFTVVGITIVSVVFILLRLPMSLPIFFLN